MSNDLITPQLTRFTVVDTNDAGPQQLIHATGLQGQDIGQMVRLQHFGESSNPPAGAEGLALALGGSGDRLFALGLEHPAFRPTGLPIGSKAIYDAGGNIISLVMTSVRIVSPTKVTIQAPQIELIGNCTLGGAVGSGKAAAMLGTVDSGGNADVSNLATKVMVN